MKGVWQRQAGREGGALLQRPEDITDGYNAIDLTTLRLRVQPRLMAPYF